MTPGEQRVFRDVLWPDVESAMTMDFAAKHELDLVRVHPWGAIFSHAGRPAQPSRYIKYRERSLDALRRRLERRDEAKIVVAYADGSGTRQDKPAGAGAVVLEAGHDPILVAHHLDGGTNNVAELWAIWCALREVPDAEANILVKSDSEYAIGILSNLTWEVSANRELVSDIREDLSIRGKHVAFEHVRGHKGVWGNEICDGLAKMARLHG